MDQHNIEKMTEQMQLRFKDTTTTVFNELYTMKLGLCIIICLHIKMLKDGWFCYGERDGRWRLVK